MEKRTYGELVYTINSLGTIKEILDSPELIDVILNSNDKHLILVFAEMVNHELNVKTITHTDLANLRNIGIIISLIQNNELEVLLDKIKYMSVINDADIQIMLYTNPIIINYIASNSFDINLLNNLCLESNLEIIKKLIEMKYVEKAYLVSEHMSNTLKNIRHYNENKEEKNISER